MKRDAQYFVGIDLHKLITQVCLLGPSGEIIEEKRFTGESLEDEAKVIEFLAQWKDGGRFCVEAVGFNRWLVNACLDAGLDIVVVDAAKLNLRMLGRKTDRRDAYEIARRLRLGDVERNAVTYDPNELEFGARKLVRTRHQLTSLRQQLVNQIRAVLATYRITAPANQLYRPRALQESLTRRLPALVPVAQQAPIGTQLTLEHSGEPGAVVAPAFSGSLGPALSLLGIDGLVHLDLTFVVLLPSVTLDGAGLGSTTALVPASPPLSGSHGWFQAAEVAVGVVQLSNPARVEISL